MKDSISNCKLRRPDSYERHGRASVRPWRIAPGTAGRSVALTIALLLLIAAGCENKTDNDQATAAEKSPARSVVESGPVKVTVEVEPAKIRLSDEPVLTLTIESEKGVQVEKPPFGASLGNFVVRDFHEPLPKTRDNREIIQQLYTLEPMQTGKMLIDPISVAFVDLRPNGDEKTHTIQTEALSLEVSSMVEGGAPSLDNLRPAAAPIELPAHWSVLAWSIAALCLILGIAGVSIFRLKRRTKALVAIVLPPEELARLELEKLAKSGLAETDVKQFYVVLTAIVRRYIERTTQIRAPEQTTEEFLREISRANTFNPQTSERLRDFLESADLVKFAAHHPRPEDISESLSRARMFINAKSQDNLRQAQEAAA